MYLETILMIWGYSVYTVVCGSFEQNVCYIPLISIICSFRTATYGRSFFLLFMAQARSARFWKGDRELEVHTPTYGPGIDQSQHAKSVSHIIKGRIWLFGVNYCVLAKKVNFLILSLCITTGRSEAETQWWQVGNIWDVSIERWVEIYTRVVYTSVLFINWSAPMTKKSFSLYLSVFIILFFRKFGLSCCKSFYNHFRNSALQGHGFWMDR